MKNMKVKPIRDYVSVKLDPMEEVTPGGIYVPKIVEQGIVTGTVLDVGTGRVNTDGKSVKLVLKKDDKICFWKQGAAEVKTNDGVVLLLREEQVLCKLVENE